MNQQDLNELTNAWHSDTNWLNEKIDEFFKAAQDNAYALGLARGLKESEAKHTTPQPAPAPLTDEQIRAMCKESWVFETVKQWVRITEQAHGITGGQHDGS